MTYQNFTIYDLENEIWKPLPNYERRYEVSNLGRVKSLRGGWLPFIMKQNLNDYLYLRLWNGGKYKNFSVHFLVMRTFVGERPLGYEINHKNFVKTDNRLANLEYITPLENTKHAIQNDRKKFDYLNGSNNHNAKLTKIQAKAIYRRLQKGEKNKILASEYEVSLSVIYLIKTNQHWSSKIVT